MLSPDMAAFCAANSKRKPPASARYGGNGGRADENGVPQVQFAYPHGATVLVQVHAHGGRQFWPPLLQSPSAIDTAWAPASAAQ
jgi:hypothetical protein